MSNTESDWSGRNEGEPTLQQILERPMITEEGEEGATKAKETCPVSKVLKAAEIRLTATLKK